MTKIYTSILLILITFQVALAGNDDNRLFTMFPVPLNLSTLTIHPTSTNTNISTVELRNLVGKKLQEKKRSVLTPANGLNRKT